MNIPITPNIPTTPEKTFQENITQMTTREICDFSVRNITKTEYLNQTHLWCFPQTVAVADEKS